MKRTKDQLAAIDPVSDRRWGPDLELVKIEDALTRLRYWQPLREAEAAHLTELAGWMYDLAGKNGVVQGR